MGMFVLEQAVFTSSRTERMDGYQFATHVRNDAKFKDLPIIMITSRSGEKHRARAIEIGVNDYLSKPYQEATLITAMENLLGREL